MDESRRRFLKEAGCAALGVGWGLPLVSTACRTAAVSQEPAAAASKSQWAMVIDVDKCQRDDLRRACADACHREHNVPDIPDLEEEVKWIWSAPYEDAFPDQVHARTPETMRTTPVLVLCNHCTNPPCVRVCPTQATWKREEDGIVMMDMHRCIGCRYCMAACPYGARSFNWRDPREYIEGGEDGAFPSAYPTRSIGVVEKCNFCAERLRSGEEPACVEAARQVPGGEGALTFGDLADPGSPVSRLLRERRTIVRRAGLGTEPNVFYIV